MGFMCGRAFYAGINENRWERVVRKKPGSWIGPKCFIKKSWVGDVWYNICPINGESKLER